MFPFTLDADAAARNLRRAGLDPERARRLAEIATGGGKVCPTPQDVVASENERAKRSPRRMSHADEGL